MLRYLLSAILVFASVFAVGYGLSVLAAKLNRLISSTARDPANRPVMQLGYGYLCFLLVDL